MKFISRVFLPMVLSLWASISIAEIAPPCEEVVKAISGNYPQEKKYTIAQRPYCEGFLGRQVLVYELTAKKSDHNGFDTEEKRLAYVQMLKPGLDAAVCDASDLKQLMRFFRIKYIASFQSTSKKYLIGSYDLASCKKITASGAVLGSNMVMDMDSCKAAAATQNKKLPLKVDEVTTRKSVSCRRGFTKTTSFVLNDEIKSDKSPLEWRNAFDANQSGLDAYRKSFCSTATAKTMLKLADVVLSYSVAGEKVGELPFSEEDCQN